MSTVTVVIPKRLWLSSNRHAVNRGHRAAIVRELHDEMFKAAYRARLTVFSEPVRAEWTVRYPKGVSWLHGDAANAHPTTKACLDSLVDRGYIPGDGPLHVVAETFARGPNLDRPSDHEITLLLSEVP